MGVGVPAGIGRGELLALAGRGGQLVGVLPAGEYDLARLPGAVSVPVREAGAGTGQLDWSWPVIVYCRDWL